MLQWAYGSNNSRKVVKKCITSTMTGFTMPDANQIMFSHIIKARGKCYAFGRCCRKSTRPFAASKYQPFWQMKPLMSSNPSIREPNTINNCSHAAIDILWCKKDGSSSLFDLFGSIFVKNCILLINFFFSSESTTYLVMEHWRQPNSPISYTWRLSQAKTFWVVGLIREICTTQSWLTHLRINSFSYSYWQPPIFKWKDHRNSWKL